METPGDERNPVPTRECKHLHYFNKGIAKALPQLINAPVIYPGHSANEVSMVERIVSFAAFNNLPVFRWAKPAFGKKDNQNANMVFNLHNEFSNSAAIYPGLFGYFVQGLPVRINHNASLEGRVVNGTMGTLHSLSPFDITEIDKKVAEAKKRDLSGSVAGTIIDISTPIGVYIDCPTAEECFRNGKVCFLSDPVNDVKRRETVTLAKKTSSTRAKVVVLSDSGYVSALGGTCYSFQGQTMPYNFFDLNDSHGNPITLAYFLVCISRIKDSMNCFVMPFINEEEQKKKLYALCHPDLWYIWNTAYDENGIFQPDRIKPISELRKKYNPNVNKPLRPTFSSTTSRASISAGQQNMQVSTQPASSSISAVAENVSPLFSATTSVPVSAKRKGAPSSSVAVFNLQFMPPPKRKPAMAGRNEISQSSAISPMPLSVHFADDVVSAIKSTSSSGSSIDVRRAPIFEMGIENIGATCYLAVVVQVL